MCCPLAKVVALDFGWRLEIGCVEIKEYRGWSLGLRD